MNAMLSRTTKSTKGVRFYRLMAIIGMCTSVFYGAVFLIIYPDGNELIWDRVFVLAISFVGYLMTISKKIDFKIIYRYSNILFYTFTAQVAVSAAMNSFQFTYLVALILVMQALSISFRNNAQAARYLVSVCLACGALLLYYPSTEVSGFFVFMTLVVSSLLLMITVRIKAKFQRNFKIHEELLTTIVSKTEYALFLTDFEGDIFDINSRCEDLFGFTRDEFIGRNFSVFRHKALSEADDEIGVKAMLENKFWTTEIELERKDGSIFIGYVSVGWIKKFEKEYLIYRVKDITIEKDRENELIEALRKAEEAVKMKSQFLATMSHEIRTPMNGVVGMTALLARTKLNGQQTNFVDTIKKSGENLLVIINDILDFSKIESGKIELDSHAFDLKEMLMDILDLLGPIAKSKLLDITLHISSNAPDTVVADSTRLKQVLINLLNNAIKFTPNGNVCVQVDAIVGIDGKLNLQFQVIDTGIGIPLNKVDTLFDSFTQVDSSTTREYGGTGLGLSICKELVELMGGEIRVISNGEKGSTFEFNVAYELASEVTLEATNLQELIDAQIISLNMESQKILIAEDNVINQKVALMMLEGLGGTADVVANGAEVLAKCKKENYDLILMDIQMPEMDGIEATEQLNRSMGDKRPYIIALTANAMQSDKDRCLNAGMNDFLSKPIILNDFKLALLAAFQEKVDSEICD
ncbi:MAG: PAS domain S-box-containing protein [Gammaproteobacteria bacterium]|jgi:PAS domain S-box-containing protein